jgi:hypothetical protein
MDPTSDRERAIANIIDARASAGDLPITAVGEIAAEIPFSMSRSEIQFLIRYIIWRRDHPIRAINFPVA